VPLAGEDDLHRIVSRGDVLGYLISPEDVVIRTVVPQTDVDLITQDTQSIALLLPGADGASLAARPLRDSPSAITRLPHPAFAALNGGRVLTNPTLEDGLVPLESQFMMDLSPVDAVPAVFLGQRVTVKFVYTPQPLAKTLWTRVRQIFLRDLNL
jgi:putative peptide zinc metalloprotease protein